MPSAKGSTFLGSANVDVRLGTKRAKLRCIRLVTSHVISTIFWLLKTFLQCFSSRFYFCLKITHVWSLWSYVRFFKADKSTPGFENPIPLELDSLFGCNLIRLSDDEWTSKLRPNVYKEGFHRWKRLNCSHSLNPREVRRVFHSAGNGILWVGLILEGDATSTGHGTVLIVLHVEIERSCVRKQQSQGTDSNSQKVLWQLHCGTRWVDQMGFRTGLGLACLWKNKKHEHTHTHIYIYI